MREVKSKIRSFLLQYIRNQGLRDDEDIFAAGFVNSLFAMQLVLFIEREFEIRIEKQDLKLENFRSIEALDRLVSSKVVIRSGD